MRRAIKPFLPPPVKGGDQLPIVVDGSPLAIIGIFIEILRERFAPGNGMDEHYLWYADMTQTNIVIESAFRDTSQTRNKKPALFVDKDQSVYGKVILGDRAGHTFKDGKEFEWTLSTVPVLIDCVAGTPGESAILGDIVQWTIHAASDAIQGAFALHDLSPPTLGRTIPYEADKEAWTTPVSFRVQYNVRWTTVPVAPLLQAIRQRINVSGASASNYFVSIVSRG